MIDSMNQTIAKTIAETAVLGLISCVGKMETQVEETRREARNVHKEARREQVFTRREARNVQPLRV